MSTPQHNKKPTDTTANTTINTTSKESFVEKNWPKALPNGRRPPHFISMIGCILQTQLDHATPHPGPVIDAEKGLREAQQQTAARIEHLARVYQLSKEQVEEKHTPHELRWP